MACPLPLADTISIRPAKANSNQPTLAALRRSAKNSTPRLFVGTEQQHPVENQRHPAQAHQNELPGNAGDYIIYLANVPHVFEALEADTTAVMVIEHS